MIGMEPDDREGAAVIPAEPGRNIVLVDASRGGVDAFEGPSALNDAVRAADRTARMWEASEAGPIVLGSEGH